MEKYDFIEALFRNQVSDELFFGVRNLEVSILSLLWVITNTVWAYSIDIALALKNF